MLAQGIVSGEHVFCPMHDWRINTTDGRVAEPDIGCVKTCAVKIEGDDVYIFV